MKKYILCHILILAFFSPLFILGEEKNDPLTKKTSSEYITKVDMQLNQDMNIIVADAFLDKAIKKYQKRIMKDPYIVKAHYREKSKNDKTYLMYTEGIGYLVSFGYHVSVPVDNFSFFSKNIRKRNRKNEWLKLLENLYQTSPVTQQTSFSPAYNSLFSCFRWFEIKGPLLNRNKYTFYEVENNPKIKDSVIAIGFKPSTEHSEEKKVYYGTLYLHRETLDIVYVELDKTPFYSNPFRKWIPAKLDIRYSKQNNNFYMSQLSVTYTHDGIKHSIDFNLLSDQYKEVSFSENEYRYACSYDSNPMVYYDPLIWEKNQIPKTQDYNKIKKDLGAVIPLNQQYKENSDKPFYQSVFPGYKDQRKYMKEAYNFVNQKIEEYEKKY